MIRLLTAVLLFASFNVVAQTQVPNVFEDGTPASAAEVNANFDAIEAALPPTNCTADQIIKWDDTNDAWVCATGDLAGLVCEEEDTITFRNGTWQCSSATPPEEPCTTTYYRDYDDDGYDCDGQEERLYGWVGTCQYAGGTSCNYNPGWYGSPVPSCGQFNDWITACEFQFEFTGSTCMVDSSPRTQTCQ